MGKLEKTPRQLVQARQMIQATARKYWGSESIEDLAFLLTSPA